MIIDIIKRAIKVDIPLARIAYLLDKTWDELEATMKENDIEIPAIPPEYVGRPSKLPDSYFIHHFQEGTTIEDMAKEIDCTTDAIYKTLRQRNLSKYQY